MTKYFATVQLQSGLFRIALFADNPLHAKLILEYQFGIGSVIKSPVVAAYNCKEEILKDGTFGIIKPKKPLSLAQARIENLIKQKDTANKNLKAERDRQKIIKAQQTIRQASSF